MRSPTILLIPLAIFSFNASLLPDEDYSIWVDQITSRLCYLLSCYVIIKLTRFIVIVDNTLGILERHRDNCGTIWFPICEMSCNLCCWTSENCVFVSHEKFDGYSSTIPLFYLMSFVIEMDSSFSNSITGKSKLRRDKYLGRIVSDKHDR